MSMFPGTAGWMEEDPVAARNQVRRLQWRPRSNGEGWTVAKLNTSEVGREHI